MSNILTVLRWSLSLGVKFYRVVPLLTLIIVFLTLTAQISSLLAFFLPLKILILLASDGVPRYFPSVFSQTDREVVIGWLSAAAVAFFLLSLLAKKLTDLATDAAAAKLLSRSQKIVLFENQDDVAAKSYQRYSSALAGGVFIPLALGALGWFYPSMGGVIAGYLLLVFFLFTGLYNVNEAFKGYLDRKLSDALTLAGNLGFFVVFAYLVLDFLFFSPPGFIFGIISLIVSRQVFGRAAAIANGILGLARQRLRLDALFFHGKVLSNHQPKQGEKTLWSLLKPEERTSWLAALFEEADVEGFDAEQMKVTWLESSQLNMPHLLVSHSGEKGPDYLVKIFDTNRKSLAQHEASLATEMLDRIPMPGLLLATQLGNFPCHVYELSPGRVLSAKGAKSKISLLNAQLLRLELPKRLVDRYLRSRPLLADRLSSQSLERLYLACSKREEVLAVAELVERLAEIQLHLRALPLVLVNPAIKTSTWLGSEDQSLVVLNWGKWSLEPAGAGWPVGSRALRVLAQESAAVAEEKRNSGQFEPEKAQLAALMFELERLNYKQQLLRALNLLPRILETLDALQKN